MSSHSDFLTLGFVGFALAVVILAMIMKWRHQRRASVISLLSDEPATPPDWNRRPSPRVLEGVDSDGRSGGDEVHPVSPPEESSVPAKDPL
ncbi:hypothetical protein HRbin08_00027 [bacterium HR08]|nr:hypothetical protein HRbin08_00027 [bacterium HR08]